MSCCPKFTCLDVDFNACAAFVEIPVSAFDSGIYKMKLHFDNAVYSTSIAVVEGENIIVPNRFNENYTHTLSIYRPDGTLLNSTCYTIRTMISISGGGAGPTPPPMPTGAREVYSIEIVLTGATEITLSGGLAALVGGQLIAASLESTDESILSEVTLNNTTLTVPPNNAGQKLFIIYKK